MNLPLIISHVFPNEFLPRGQFYAVSGPLLRAIPSSALSREVIGPEDLEFGRMVTDGGLWCTADCVRILRIRVCAFLIPQAYCTKTNAETNSQEK